MTKISRSVSFEAPCFNKVMEIARHSFGRNFSAALNWMIYSKMPEKEFYSWMAKYHASQLNHFKDLKDSIEHVENPQKILEVMVE